MKYQKVWKSSFIIPFTNSVLPKKPQCPEEPRESERVHGSTISLPYFSLDSGESGGVDAVDVILHHAVVVPGHDGMIPPMRSATQATQG